MLLSMLLEEKKGFSSNECLIADYFLEKKEAVKYESAREIAKKIYVSPSILIRFSQKLGFDGYNHFKETYLDELKYLSGQFNDIDANYPFQSTDSNSVVANKIACFYKEIVDDTMSLIEQSSLEQAVSFCLKADTIYICSAGPKQALAESFIEKMTKIGKRAVSYPYMNVQYYAAHACEARDCFILISYSGETEFLLKTARVLKERRIHTILITSYGGSTASDMFPVKLYMSTHESIADSVGEYGAYLSPMLWLDILYSCVFRENYEQNMSLKQSLTRFFETNRYSSNNLIK